MIGDILNFHDAAKTCFVVLRNGVKTWAKGATDNNGYLCCPECRRSEWSIKGIAISCNYCYSMYENYGVYGLKKIEKEISHEV